MKKHLLWLSVVVVVTIAAMGKQVKEAIAPAKPVEKSVSFALYREGNYTSDIYNSTSAMVHITIEKVSGKKRRIVWEKTFDAQVLKQYPSMQEAIAQTVKVPDVCDAKEHLEISYILTYNSNGSELQMQNGWVVKDNGSAKVYIGI
ncbi:MAG: hypothetical protein ABI861_00620 [Panacibacter sp.]